MEEILGSHIDDHVFDEFLENWSSILAARIEHAERLIGQVDGVEGLILAGSNGVGHPWPLSDIDLIPIYADEKTDAARDRVENARCVLLNEWSQQGWRTGVDVGRLFFTQHELQTVFSIADPDPLPLLADDRWYHSLDKAFGSRVLLDSDGHVGQLSKWFTAHRFDSSVVELRLRRSIDESGACLDLVTTELNRGNRAGAFSALLKSIQWYQIHLMEEWNQRDNSLGRFGTRFEQIAGIHQASHVVEALVEITSLSPDQVHSRLEQAPRWVLERRDRSWRSRKHIGEPVTKLQNDRDVLRVCTTYELRVIENPPFDTWLAVPDERGLLERKEMMKTLLRDHRCVDAEMQG